MEDKYLTEYTKRNICVCMYLNGTYENEFPKKEVHWHVGKFAKVKWNSRFPQKTFQSIVENMFTSDMLIFFSSLKHLCF